MLQTVLNFYMLMLVTNTLLSSGILEPSGPHHQRRSSSDRWPCRTEQNHPKGLSICWHRHQAPKASGSPWNHPCHSSWSKHPQAPREHVWSACPNAQWRHSYHGPVTRAYITRLHVYRLCACVTVRCVSWQEPLYGKVNKEHMMRAHVKLLCLWNTLSTQNLPKDIYTVKKNT